MSKSERRLLSGTYANGVLRSEPRVRELALALEEQDLRQDGDGDLSRRLVPEAQPDRGVQPRIVARAAAEAPGDAAQDQGDFPAAADQPDVARLGAKRRFEHVLVQRVAAGEDHHEVRRTGKDAAERILRQIDAAHLAGAGEPGAGGKLLAIVDH